MDEFENGLVNGIHKSRYVASWINSGGTLDRGNRFREWLGTLIINGRNLTEEEIRYIFYFAENGKLELQESARSFLKGA